jgi:hypothetical protein
MPDFAHSSLFNPWKDPGADVTIYLLAQKVAPVQEAFYFVNNSMSDDGRYLWFYCAFPPSGSANQGRTLGVVDFEAQEVRAFPETQFNSASPWVDPASGEVYWCMGDTIWQRGPGARDETRRVNSLPKEIVQNRPVHRLATHLTRSADGREFFVDAAVGLGYIFGSLPVNGGDFQFWQRFDRNYNHAQFNPQDPDQVVFAQENHTDPITGIHTRYDDRLWMMRRGEKPRPVLPTPTRVTHEWWDAGGKHVWCIRGREGVWRVAIENGDVEEIPWKGGTWHSHCTQDGMYFIGDANEQFYRGCPSTVNFLNRRTQREARLASNPEMPGITGANYHIDPHPRFCGAEQYVVFTTTVRGEVDLAIAPTRLLIDITS